MEKATNENQRIKRIGVLTSGGDAPGMNAAIRAVVRTAASLDIECVGIKRGWQGLINADFAMLSKDSVSHILTRGGTMLYTARSEEFMQPNGRKKAAATCRMLGIDAIVAIGGDGTFNGAHALSKEGIPVVGIPATIDNDVDCSNYTIGFDTACNTAVDCIDRLRDTMLAHERCSLVEVMGRNAGYLALYVGLAAGATAVLVPEHKYDFQKDVVERIQQSRLAGNSHFMLVVAEGAGSAVEIGKRIYDAIGIEPRVTVLGHIQRGGSPSARDRETATRMGYTAVKALSEGRTNCVIATKEGYIVEIPIDEAMKMKKHLQIDRYRIMQTMQLGSLKDPVQLG
ncbi:MAG: 6-phosphofructokinase [Clostridia bacterium]|nr:6-phosphofructokinase [Clostridia bacterium]